MENVETKEKVVVAGEKNKPADNKEGKPVAKNGDRRNNRNRRPASRDEEKKEFSDRVVDINRISKTVQGGRHMRFSALVVVGDFKGRYGFALEKSGEVPDAIKKSTEAAKHNIHRIDIVRSHNNATIAHEVIGKFGATSVYLKPAPAGTGIIAGGPVRAILELAGLKNVVSKVYGARASINVIRATHDAIGKLKSRSVVNALRGKNQPLPNKPEEK